MKKTFVPGQFITTRGGWRRAAPTWHKSFNTLIQGLAADIFRWVLRELDQELAKIEAFIVHHAHDEVFVAVLPNRYPEAEAIVRQVMY